MLLKGPPRTGCALTKIYLAPNVNSARLEGPPGEEGFGM